MTLLEIKKLTKKYRSTFALRELNLSVQQGEIVGLIGHNGAGKTTTIKCIMGFTRPDAGEMFYKGTPVAFSQFYKEVGFLPEINQMTMNLTAREYLKYALGFNSQSTPVDDNQISSLLKKVGLENTGRKLIRTFSKGMKQCIGIAQAIAHNPQLLILDEPFTGLDPVRRDLLRSALSEQHQKGATILFSSHNLADVQEICTSIAVIHYGIVVYQGGVQTFIKQQSAANLDQAFLNSFRSISEASDV